MPTNTLAYSSSIPKGRTMNVLYSKENYLAIEKGQCIDIYNNMNNFHKHFSV